MQKLAKNLVSKVDMFPAKANLKSGSKGSIKSGSTGVISLLFGAGFLIYLSTRLIQAFQLKEVKHQATVEALQRNQTKANFSTFGVSIDFLPIEKIEQMFVFYLWMYKEDQFVKKIEFKPCVEEEWSELGPNYKQQFIDKQINRMFCPLTKETLYLKQVFGDGTPDYLNFQLYKCNPDKNPKCKPEAMQKYLRNQTENERGFNVFVYILDTIVYPDRYDGIKTHLNTETKGRIRETTGQEVFVEFSTFNMSTDLSIFPLKYIEKNEGTRVGNVRSTQIKIDNLTNVLDDYKKEHNGSTTNSSAGIDTSNSSSAGTTNSSVSLSSTNSSSSTSETTNSTQVQPDLPDDEPLLSIIFTMNEQITMYDRSVKKITEYLAEFGGFVSIIMSVLGFFIAGYNAHKYELGVADKAFKEDQQKMKAKDFGMMTYVRYTIYTYTNKVFGKKLDWDDCKKVDYTKKESGGLMQIDSIFKRLQTLETMVRFSTDANEMKIIKLIEPQSIKEAEQERWITRYYAKIIKKGSNNPSLKDMRKTYDLKDEPLENMILPSNPSEVQSSASGGNSPLFSPTSSSAQMMRFDMVDEAKFISQEKKQKKTLEAEDDFQLLRKCIDQFKEIKRKAENITLSGKLKKVQQKLAKSFKRIHPEKRQKMQERIPIVLLHRLFIALDEQKEKKGGKSKKVEVKSKVGSAKPEKTKPDAKGKGKDGKGKDDKKKDKDDKDKDDEKEDQEDDEDEGGNDGGDSDGDDGGDDDDAGDDGNDGDDGDDDGGDDNCDEVDDDGGDDEDDNEDEQQEDKKGKQDKKRKKQEQGKNKDKKQEKKIKAQKKQASKPKSKSTSQEQPKTKQNRPKSANPNQKSKQDSKKPLQKQKQKSKDRSKEEPKENHLDKIENMLEKPVQAVQAQFSAKSIKRFFGLR